MDDTLGSNYNLGRITGGPSVTNLTSFVFPEKSFIMVDIFGNQVGMEDVFSFDWYILNAIGASRGYGMFLLMLPEFALNTAPSPAHRIKCRIAPANWFFGAAGKQGISGSDAPFYMLNTYEWQYLSRKGRIHLPSTQFDNVFYFQPLVNPGQIWLKTNLLHTIREESEDARELPEIFNLYSRASVGILNNLQLGGDIIYKRYSILEFFGIGWEIGSIWKEIREDSLMATGMLNYRPGPFSVQCGYSFLDHTHDSSKTLWHMGFGSVAHILGKRIQSINQVRGNWDGYFTPYLGHHQLLTQLSLKYAYSPGDVDIRRYTLDNGIHFGLFKFCSIGERFRFKTGDYLKNSYDLTIDLTCMNIPLREKGPSQVSKFEYMSGFLPDSNKVRVDIQFRIPIQRLIKYYPSPEDIWDLMAEEVSMTMSPLDYFDPERLDSERKMSQYDPFSGILRNRDFSFRFIVGLARNSAISNTFELRVDKFAEVDNPIINDPWQEEYETLSKNVLYVNSFGISTGKPDRSRYTVMGTIFGQTDDNVDSGEKAAFILSGFLQLSF